ncbi:hypothetical protein WJX73_006453 [Symbiochloris irregularis]|uniref:peptidylprolyl isomerase n=1 Tax=Symbiochloris irregularis TaxID=706552 RepID=A0AAW1PN85_9CHLO
MLMVNSDVNRREHAPVQSIIVRLTLQFTLLALTLLRPLPAYSLGFQKELKKRKIPEEQYNSNADGSRSYDLSAGSGSPVKTGDKVKVHFDCLYKGIDVSSSRSARLLGGNRTLAEPLEFTAGKSVSSNVADRDVESAGGLFSGQNGPKAPPVLSNAVVGMKKGGKRSVLVPPELGYGKEGLMEIPPNSSFELQIELLSIG